jgi:hypothetical protein
MGWEVPDCQIKKPEFNIKKTDEKDFKKWFPFIFS